MRPLHPLWATVPIAASVAAILAAGHPGSAVGADDPAAEGARIAALGNGRGVPACASCHAYNGEADPSGAFPRLAGQSRTYLLASLNAYADGQRKNALMSGIAAGLSDQERADVAAYYASVAAPVPPAPPVDERVVDLGRVIATVGLNDQQIVACATCHGPFGHSATPPIPSLAGQYARYIEFELQMFRSGERTSGAAVMAGFSHRLSDEQARAVAAYFQRVQPSPVALASSPSNQPTGDQGAR